MGKRSTVAIIVLILIIGIFIGNYAKLATLKLATLNAKKPIYWIDTMEPTIRYPGPGKSRMGMELVPVYADEVVGTTDISISPTVINNLGVRTAPVTLGTLTRRIATVGYVAPNENKISHIHSYADGWVRKLLVKATGEPVKQGQILLQFYSPVLVNAQEEYLLALESNNQTLINASIKKLEALHISLPQMQQLQDMKKSNQLIDIVAPQDGIVSALNIREGMHITPDTEIMSLVDLSSIWIIVQVFAEQANWVKTGAIAEAKLPAFPGKVWKGIVEYVYPEIDATTRTLKVRLRFDNTDSVLKPNMYASIALFIEPKLNVLTIPMEALIRSSQGNRVIVALGNGRFQVRSVNIGIESDEQIEIVSGLNADELVVASGQFLIDSEANLKMGLQQIETERDPSWSNIVVHGTGIIKAVNIQQNLLTLQHEPISALSWPEMTMDFSVNKSVNLSQFAIGDKVMFTFRKNTENKYVIMHIKKLPQ